MTSIQEWLFSWFLYSSVVSVKIVKVEFGKTEKDTVKPDNFEPVHSSFHVSSEKEMLRRGLQEVYPHSVALQFLLSHRILRTLKP